MAISNDVESTGTSSDDRLRLFLTLYVSMVVAVRSNKKRAKKKGQEQLVRSSPLSSARIAGSSPIDHSVMCGLGVLTPFGSGLDSFFAGPVPKEDDCNDVGCSDFGFNHISDDLINNLLTERQTAGMDRQTKLSASAAHLALKDSDRKGYLISLNRSGVLLGIGISVGGSVSDFYDSVLRNGPRLCEIGKFPNTVMNAAASRVAILNAITGPNITVASGMNSGVDAVGMARDGISNGFYESALVGAVEGFSEETVRAFRLSRRASVDHADGLNRRVVGMEAAVSIVMCKSDNWESPSAPYGRVAGYGSAYSSSGHNSNRDVSHGVELCLRQAFAGTNHSPREVDLALVSGPYLQSRSRSNFLCIDEKRQEWGFRCPFIDMNRRFPYAHAAHGILVFALAIGFLRDSARLGTIASSSDPAPGKKIKSVLVILMDDYGHNSAVLVTK